MLSIVINSIPPSCRQVGKGVDSRVRSFPHNCRVKLVNSVCERRGFAWALRYTLDLEKRRSHPPRYVLTLFDVHVIIPREGRNRKYTMFEFQESGPCNFWYCAMQEGIETRCVSSTCNFLLACYPVKLQMGLKRRAVCGCICTYVCFCAGKWWRRKCPGAETHVGSHSL